MEEAAKNSARPSPFQVKMVRMKAPEGYGGTVGFRGFELEPDEEGIIEVPDDGVSEMKAHGFSVVVTETATPKPAAKKPSSRPKVGAGDEAKTE